MILGDGKVKGPESQTGAHPKHGGLARGALLRRRHH